MNSMIQWFNLLPPTSVFCTDHVIPHLMPTSTTATDLRSVCIKLPYKHDYAVNSESNDVVLKMTFPSCYWYVCMYIYLFEAIFVCVSAYLCIVQVEKIPAIWLLFFPYEYTSHGGDLCVCRQKTEYNFSLSIALCSFWPWTSWAFESEACLH
jgi:hypothetical protein